MAKRKINIFWKRLHENAVLPKRATERSLCFDFFSPETHFLAPGEKKMIPLGLAWEPLDEDVHLLVFPRGGRSRFHPNYIANNVGVIDNDYRGEFIAPIINNGKETMIIKPHQAIAQGLIYLDDKEYLFLEVEDIEPTGRNEGGFGSTDESIEEVAILEQANTEGNMGN